MNTRALITQIGPPLFFFAFFVMSWYALVEFFDIPPYLLPDLPALPRPFPRTQIV